MPSTQPDSRAPWSALKLPDLRLRLGGTKREAPNSRLAAQHAKGRLLQVKRDAAERIDHQEAKRAALQQQVDSLQHPLQVDTAQPVLAAANRTRGKRPPNPAVLGNCSSALHHRWALRLCRNPQNTREGHISSCAGVMLRLC